MTSICSKAALWLMLILVGNGSDWDGLGARSRRSMARLGQMDLIFAYRCVPSCSGGSSMGSWEALKKVPRLFI